MTMDVSKTKNLPQTASNRTSSAVKQAYADKNDLKQGKVKGTQIQGANNRKNIMAQAKHYARLAFLAPHLETLPDVSLHFHAIELAATVLTLSIERDVRKLTVANIRSNPTKPVNSSNFEFTLQISKKAEESKESQDLKMKTDAEVEKFKLFCKR